MDKINYGFFAVFIALISIAYVLAFINITLRDIVTRLDRIVRELDEQHQKS